MFLQVKLSSLNLDDHARKKMIKLCGERYAKDTDTLTITTDRWASELSSTLNTSHMINLGLSCVFSAARWDSRTTIMPCTCSRFFITSPGWVFITPHATSHIGSVLTAETRFISREFRIFSETQQKIFEEMCQGFVFILWKSIGFSDFDQHSLKYLHLCLGCFSLCFEVASAFIV